MRNQKDIFADILALAGPQPDELIQASQPLARENRKLAERVLEDLTDVQAHWLGNATPIVEELLAKAEDPTLSDADFVKAVEDMALAIPDLFDKLDWHSLASSMEKVAGAAMVNGIAQRLREFANGE